MVSVNKNLVQAKINGEKQIIKIENIKNFLSKILFLN